MDHSIDSKSLEKLIFNGLINVSQASFVFFVLWYSMIDIILNNYLNIT